MGILYNLILEGLDADGILSEKEAIDLIFRGFNYKNVKKHCYVSYDRDDVQDFIEGSHYNPCKFLSERTLSFIDNKYGKLYSNTIGIWKGIKPQFNIDQYNSKTLRIIRDKWPSLIEGITDVDVLNNRKLIKTCADLIPIDKIKEHNRTLYLMNYARLDDVFNYITSHTMIEHDCYIFHRIWNELPHRIDYMLRILHYGATNCMIIIPKVIVMALQEKYDVDCIILMQSLHDCIHLVKNKDLLKYLRYTPCMYKACKKLGTKFKVTSNEQLITACSLGHKVIIPSSWFSDDLELILQLLDIHDNITLEYITIPKSMYSTFKNINHKYIIGSSKIVKAADREFILYITYSIPGSVTLYGLTKSYIGGFTRHIKEYCDITLL